MPPTTSPTPARSSRSPTTSASPRTSATATSATGRPVSRSLVDRHRGETVVVVRGGDEPDPVLLLVDADGVSTQTIEGLS